MKVVSTLTGIALALGLTAPLAWAPKAALADEMRLDANGDTMVDQDEWTAFGGHFEDLDANDDGFLSEDEWASAMMPTGGDQPVFGMLDVNEDVQIGEDEFFSDESFAELDENQSGRLDREEFGAGDEFGISRPNGSGSPHSSTEGRGDSEDGSGLNL
jgi:hypothetical protein